MEIVILIVKMFVLTYILSDMVAFIADLIAELRPTFKVPLFALIFNMLIYVMSCEKCFSFWTTLILTGNIFIAAAVALLVKIISKLENKFGGETKL